MSMEINTIVNCVLSSKFRQKYRLINMTESNGSRRYGKIHECDRDSLRSIIKLQWDISIRSARVCACMLRSGEHDVFMFW